MDLPLRLTAPVGGTSYTWVNQRLLEARLNGVKLRLLEGIEYSQSNRAADAGDDERRPDDRVEVEEDWESL